MCVSSTSSSNAESVHERLQQIGNPIRVRRDQLLPNQLLSMMSEPTTLTGLQRSQVL